jgi:hypothetical protein
MNEAAIENEIEKETYEGSRKSSRDVRTKYRRFC